MADKNIPCGYNPVVPSGKNLPELTLKALLPGLIMCVVLGAANAYLGLKAGQTVAATYPAAVIGMAVMRAFRGNILEENMARTVGSIGESVAAGAVFTIPAFVIAGVWTDFGNTRSYLESFAIMTVGGILGILFMTMLRRVMVRDEELPYPESVAAAEIHKAGRTGGSGARYLFSAMGFGIVIQALASLKVFASSWEKFIPFSKSAVALKTSGGAKLATLQGGGGALLASPDVSPAFIGVGYIIGPRLAALNFAGGVMAWGLFVPILLFFCGTDIEAMVGQSNPGGVDWIAMAYAAWKFIVRPIAVGGMLVASAYTLYRMRSSLWSGLKHSFEDLKKAAGARDSDERVERDIRFSRVLIVLAGMSVITFLLYWCFSKSFQAAIFASVVMLVAGFLFAAVSGYLCGMIGSSNNPVSGLTLSTLVIAALLMVMLGESGPAGLVATLGVAAVICVALAVSGEMLQDLKVGHILGGTPWKMQIGNIIGVIIASSIMFIPLFILHQGDINMGGTGFGGKNLPAPQAGMMAMLSEGIVGGHMAWPLVIAGMFMGAGFILTGVKSPMLVAVGMYVPFQTSSAIFLGGIFRWLADQLAEKRKFNISQKTRVNNCGILISSGLIAGEALAGLLFASFAFFNARVFQLFASPPFIFGMVVFMLLGLVLIVVPLKNAGKPDDPPPPQAVI